MEKNGKNNIIVIHVAELIQVFIKKLWIIVLVGALFAAAGYGYGAMTKETPMYLTTSKLYITGVESAVPSAAGINLGQQVLNSYIEILESRPVLEQVIENLNLNMTYRELQNCISEYIPAETCMLEISVTFPDPEWAKKVADELVVVSAARALEIMGCTAPTVYEEAYIPTEPYNLYGSSSLKYMVLGGVAGAFLVCCIILAGYFVNTKFTNPHKVSDKLNLPTIAVIPDSSAKNKVYEETAYQNFCHRLISIAPNFRIVDFVSATEKENKYEFLQKVAEFYKKVGKKVILLDANLTNPKWGVGDKADPNKKGLEDYLRKNAQLEDIIVEGDGIDYIYSKKAVIDGVELLQSQMYAELLTALEKRYDYILVNSAPLDYVPDALYGAETADTVVFMISGKHNRISQMKKLLSLMEEKDITVDGAVLMDMDIHKGGKYFRKEFGKYFGVYGK